MQKYKNLGGDSGVEAFEIGTNYIVVKFFKNPKLYTYSYESADEERVEEMKRRALRGEGLNEYINKHVKNDYVK